MKASHEIETSSGALGAGDRHREREPVRHFGNVCAYAWRKARFANAHLPWNDATVDHAFVARVLACFYVDQIAPDHADCLNSMRTWRRIYSVPLDDRQLERAVSDALFAHAHRRVVDDVQEKAAAAALLTHHALQVS